MSRQDDSGNDKVYRFISDPGHKENLSGRVRAACVTCRRKKIKCSGEVPCSTCEEKGIVCEGVTDRKRPKKSSDHRRVQIFSIQDGQGPPGLTTATAGSSQPRLVDCSSGDISKGREFTSRPTASLQKLGTSRSYDSGYSSGMQSGQDEALSRAPLLDTALSFDSVFATGSSSNYNNSAEISPSTTEAHDWSFLQRTGSTSYCGTEAQGSEVSRSAHVTSRAASMTSLDWPQTDKPSWWRDSQGTGQAATNLISVAIALEEQAQSLRRLASRHESDINDDNRRQTIAFPLYSENATSPGRSTQPLPGAFDDLSLILADRTPDSGVTPMASDFPSWWDADPELSSTLGFQQTSASNQQPRAFSGLSTIDSTDAGWHFEPNRNTMPESAVSSASRTRGSPAVNVSEPAIRHASRTQRNQAPASCSQLYSWPE